MPHARCPACGLEEGFAPVLRDPHSGEEISLGEWYRRVQKRFSLGHVDVDTVLPFYCSECADHAAVPGTPPETPS